MRQNNRSVFIRYLLGLVLLGVVWGCGRWQKVTLQGRTMGTTYHITLLSPKRLVNPQPIQRAVDSLLQTINASMSTFDPNSEISRFNRWHSTRPFPVSSSFLKVVKKALEIYRESDGAFDITVAPLVNLWGFGRKGPRFTVPDSGEIRRLLKHVGSQYLRIVGDSALQKEDIQLTIDLSAIAKGYGVDAVAELLRQRGFRNFLVEIGGEVFASGIREERPWQVAINKPEFRMLPGSMIEGILVLSDRAVATSGDYLNFFEYHGKTYSHEINPKTGWPIENNIASATVIAPRCITADAMATALMVMPVEKGLAWVNRKPNIESLIILRKGKERFEERQSEGFARYLTH
jgi:thiamine biosynthesis lipoprotein